MRKTSSGKFFLLCFVFFAKMIAAQTRPADSSQLYASLATVINFHNSVLKENIHLYNGWQDPGYNHLAIGQPYFMADSIQVGNIYYDDTYYPDVSMLYNLVNDNVIIVQYAVARDSTNSEYKTSLRMDLVKNKIQSFSLPGHEFVRLNADSNAIGMPPGFYERMYNGKTKLFVKRVKLYVEEVRGNELERRFDPITTYYIQKNGKYYPIRSKKALLDLLKDKKSELNSFIRSNKKRFKKNKELMIFETTQHYDQLVTP
jgi:hypothetical protein